jgi:glycosyltransferase involved in cell wall biosynthesis
VTVVSELAREEMARAFHVPVGKLAVAINGYDPVDLPARAQRPSDFVIAYLGSIDGRRDPRPFLRALVEAGRSEPQLAAAVRLRIVGEVPEWVGAVAREQLGADRVEMRPPIPHREALAIGGAAAVLLCISSRAEAGGAAMTSKLIEYLGLERPVLNLAPEGPGVALVRSLDAGEVSDPEDIPGATQAILRLYRDWKNGTERTAPPDRLADLTRQRTAAVVAGVLDRAIQARRRRPG